MPGLGIVIIGKNEGTRLGECLKAAQKGSDAALVYVDSGSTDESVALAKKAGVDVIEPEAPHSAAKGRNRGFDFLVNKHPEIKLFQFVDGDCELFDEWVEVAKNYLDGHPDITAVCGRVIEKHPAGSLYNKLCGMEWDTRVGEILACGGIFMVRTGLFKKIKGFNETVVAGEEAEMFGRLRAEKGKLVRVDSRMTQHDASIKHFSTWWKRSVRSGYAYALGSAFYLNPLKRHSIRASMGIWFWSFLLPAIALAFIPATAGRSLLVLLLIYTLQVTKTGLLHFKRHFKNQPIGFADSFLYSLFCLFIKWPQLVGQISFWRERVTPGD